MTDTANLGLPFIDGSQAQKHVTHNEALRILDDVIQIGVLDVTLTAPPSTPAEGERHVVATGATGAWAGQSGTIATYEDATWRFLAPKLGWCVWSATDSVLFVYDGTVWRDLRDLPVSLDTVGHLGINTTATSPNLLSVKSNAALFSSINAADGGTGDARIQISKESSAKTASVVFSDLFSGRAEFGLVGSDAFKLKVSSDGSTFVESLIVDQTSGNLTLPRGVLLTGVLSPSQITSNQNDYAPSNFSTANVMRISTDALRNITGFAGGAEGRAVYLVNAGSYSIILKDENASSTAANRFGFGADLTLAAKQGATLIYDGNAARWRQVGGPSASSSSGATDTDRQNSLMTTIYQSKSFAEYRRVVNIFATGFKGASDTLNGILAASSSNYTTTPGTAGATTGNVAPSVASYTRISAINSATVLGTMTYTGSLSANPNNLRDQSISTASADPGGLNSSTAMGYDLGTAYSITQITVTTINAGSFGGSNWATSAALTIQYSDDNSTWTTVSGAVTTLTIPSTSSSAAYSATIDSVNGSHRYWRLRNLSGATGGNAWLADLDMYTGGIPNSMTLVTAPQTADSTVNNGRVLVEYDNSATPTLNADLTAEISLGLLTSTLTISNASPGVITHTAHGMAAGDPLSFTTTGSLPTGLTANTTYFVVLPTTNAYNVAATPGGTAINTSSAGSGTHTANYRLWTSASLSVVTSNSQAGRKVAETVDQAATGGASFTARIKTLNGKNVPIYGLSVAVH